MPNPKIPSWYIGTLQTTADDIETKVDTANTALVAIEPETDKIDQAVTDGLTGVVDSLSYRAHEIEHHLHGRERWWGALAGPDETNAIEANVNRPFVAVSGNNTWGTAIPIVGTDDIAANAGDVFVDVKRILVVDLDDDTSPWRLRFIWGSGTSGDAIAAGQWSEMMIQSNAVPGNRAGAVPLEMQMPRIAAGLICWAQTWTAVNLDAMSFFIGVHGYEG